MAVRAPFLWGTVLGTLRGFTTYCCLDASQLGTLRLVMTDIAHALKVT